MYIGKREAVLVESARKCDFSGDSTDEYQRRFPKLFPVAVFTADGTYCLFADRVPDVNELLVLRCVIPDCDDTVTIWRIVNAKTKR